MKMIIFSQWAKMCYLIEKELKENLKETKVFIITGETQEKNKIIEAFKGCDGNAILVASDTLNYGVNLQEAECIVHFDLPWSPARIEQREGRIDRIGQQNRMLIIKLIANKTIEERVVSILEKKDTLFASVVEGGLSREFLGEVLKP